MTVTGLPARMIVVALALIACGRSGGGNGNRGNERSGSGPGSGSGSGPAASATRWEIRPCEGATAIPAAVDKILSRLESPVSDHCERHQLGGGAPALFVRTMNTVAHDEQGNRIPTCHWEVFRVAPEPVRHLGSLAVCRFRVDGRCVVGLDDAPAKPHACLGEDGALVPQR